ncbi:hypothetical protein A5N15_05835 [Rothia kristinae]|uniref:Uncharacterized protein n=1 Tax=Rothia kristinae TaxID=37923 RepID=A0A657IUJ4_9MICC|nr:hypothetical protein A5N15_05835 [Rothia kristinae]
MTPVSGQLPEDPSAREALEGMLLLPTGDITVTDAYDTGRYGEIGLVNGTEPLKQATDVVAPGEPARAYEANSAARQYVLDDGATADYTRARRTPRCHTCPPSIRCGWAPRWSSIIRWCSGTGSTPGVCSPPGG